MAEPLKCLKPGCSGTLGEKTIQMQTGCNSSSPCRYCTTCGRIHSYEGTLMFGRAGHSPYFRVGGIVLDLEFIELLPGETYITTSWMWVGINDNEDALEAGKELIFDEMDNTTFCFHDIDGVKYRLHRGSVNYVEIVTK